MPDTCPVCRNVNESGAATCLRCGVTFAAIPLTPAASAPSSEAVCSTASRQGTKAGRLRIPSRRLLVVLLALGACAAMAAVAFSWWQSGVEARRDEEAWKRARASNTTSGYRSYLTGGTLGAHSEEAKKAINRRFDAAVSKLRSRTNNGNHEAVEGFTTLAVAARDAGAEALPIFFVRDVRLGNPDVQRLATKAGASRYAAIDHALSPDALAEYEAGIVAHIGKEMRYLGFDELQLTYSTGPVDGPAIRVAYSIRSDGGLYQIVSPDGEGAAGRSATVYAGVIIRARYEFAVAGSEPLFAFDAEARPADKLRFSRDPYREMCSSGFGTIGLKFTSLFNPAPG